jgi:hypothetical protein
MVVIFADWSGRMRGVCPFVLFLLAIVLSVRLRFKDSDYPFGIIKLFLNIYIFISILKVNMVILPFIKIVLCILMVVIFADWSGRM